MFKLRGCIKSSFVRLRNRLTFNMVNLEFEAAAIRDAVSILVEDSVDSHHRQEAPEQVF